MPAADIARIVLGILENPGPHIGQAYQLHGPVEYSHAELAKVVGKVLGKPIVFEQMEMLEFIKLLGLENDKMKKHHIEAARIDQQKGLLRATNHIGPRITEPPLMTFK